MSIQQHTAMCLDNSWDPAKTAETVVWKDWNPRSTIFDELTKEEMSNVISFAALKLGLRDRRAENTSVVPPLSPLDSFVHRVELLLPPKTAALAFLERRGPRPDREARVIVHRGNVTPRDMMEYKVGPLPLGERTQITALTSPGQIPHVKHPTDSVTGQWWSAPLTKIGLSLKPVFLNMTGGVCYGEWPDDNDDGDEIKEGRSTPKQNTTTDSMPRCDSGYFDYLAYPFLHPDTHSRIATIKWHFVPGKNGAGELYLHPLPLSFKINETDADPSKWEAFDFEYCHQGPFKTADDLLHAFAEGHMHYCSMPELTDPKYDYEWATTNTRRARAATAKPGPRQFMPRGPRFLLSSDSSTGRRFKWFGWEAHVVIRADTGPVAYDVSYKGQRILYELAHQDMYVAYSGYGGAGQTFYMDSAFGIGTNTRALRRGYDCPWHAAYVKSMLNYGVSGGYTQKDTMCLFEDDMAAPSWRHTHGGSETGPHSDSARGVEFVVRTVSTIGNYDYMFDMRFKQDGSMEVKTTMAGYMSTLFHDPNGQTRHDRPFGTRVAKHVLANIHDHLSNWKVDLDVAGVNNSFVTQSVRSGTYEEALASAGIENATAPAWVSQRVLKYLDLQRPETEVGLTVDGKHPTTWHFVNDKSLNKWGNPRGYAIVPGVTSPQLLPPDHPLARAAAWTKYQVAVTRRKDSEPRSHAALYDFPGSATPVVSLDTFINGESVNDTDLVAWVTIGVQHVPRAEDVPLISNLATNFFIKPWNYFDHLESIDADADDSDDWESCAPDFTGQAQFQYNIFG